jgi:hypothetical protein
VRCRGTTSEAEIDSLICEAAKVGEIAARAAGVEILLGMGAAVKEEKLNFKDIVTEVYSMKSFYFAWFLKCFRVGVRLTESVKTLSNSRLNARSQRTTFLARKTFLPAASKLQLPWKCA